MSGELNWFPLSYDSGPGTNDPSAIAATEIVAPDFPAPHESPTRSGGQDSLLFAKSVVDLLLKSGRSPQSIVWSIAHTAGARGPTYCFVFEQRRIYCVKIISVQYESWLDGFDAEAAKRSAAADLPVPEFSFLGATLDNEKLTSAGSVLFRTGRNVMRLDQYQRAEQFHTDLHRWLRDACPDLWHGQDDRPKKEALLNEASENVGPYVSIDEDQLVSTFGRLLSERGQENLTDASEAEFAKFAEVSGFELPAELKTVLRIADGCYLGSGHCDFMSTAAITAAWKSQNEAFEGSTLESLTMFNKDPDPRTLPIDLSPQWIPITDHHSGAHLGIDLLPGPSGTPGQIIHYDRGESGAGAIALVDNLLEFFEHELAGKIVNIYEPVDMVIDEDDEWEDDEYDEEVEIVEESWIALKLVERMRAVG